MRLKQRIEVKRVNTGVEFIVPVLFAEQVEELAKEIEALGDSPTEEQINQLRRDFEAEHCALKLTISRLSEVEEHHANTEAIVQVGRAREKSNPESSVTEMAKAFSNVDLIVYNNAYSQFRWGIIRRHVKGAIEKNEAGEWETLDKKLLNEWLDIITENGRAEVSYILASYSREVTADKKKAEADENFLARDSSKVS